MALTVFVHSFGADSSLLDFCDLVVCFFHLMLAGRPPLGFLRWFQLFCFFHLVSAVCLPDHQHLWSVLPFFVIGICVQFLSFKRPPFTAVGIRVRLCLCLVSAHWPFASAPGSDVRDLRHGSRAKFEMKTSRRNSA